MPDFRWIHADGQWYVRVSYPDGPYFILSYHQAAQLAALLPPWLTGNPPNATDNGEREN